MKKWLFFSLTTVGLVVASLFLTIFITTKLNAYEENRLEIADKMSAENRLANVWEWPDWLSTDDESISNYFDLKEKGDAIYGEALNLGLLLLLVVGAYVLLNFFVYRKHDEKARIMGFVMIISAASFLYLGLNSPFLEIEAFKDNVEAKIPLWSSGDVKETIDLPDWLQGGVDYVLGEEDDNEMVVDVQGRVYFFYQNKSVLQLIKLLYTGGNIPVALIILLFSIIFPAVKLITSFVLLMSPESVYAKSAINVINKIGKWSMADVMVASIFLAYFSFSNMNMGVDTGSETLIGLYFFLAFVILSIFSGSYIKKYIQRREMNR